MKQIILHVGLEKTGTTYLQDVFSSNASELSAAGILYPITGLEDNQHYWLAKALGFNFEAENFNRNLIKGLKRQLNTEIEESRHRKILISSEHFDFNVTPERCKSLREYFSDYDVKVILFFRNQVDYAQSLYIEHIKWGGEATFKEFLDSNKKFDFFSKFKLWQSAGFDVEVVDYDSSRRDILTAFLQVAGIELPVNNLCRPELRKNVSPSIDFVELIRQLNIGCDKRKRRSQYVALTNQLVKKSKKLEKVFVKRPWRYPVGSQGIVEAWESENYKLCGELGLDPSAFLGGPLIDRFVSLEKYEPPNLNAFLLSGLSTRFLSSLKKNSRWRPW
ncbi:sulfotransferase domain-containing protein [Microbulbifer yueqingensis]|nr:sulfotransferase domain-containing protein [Microbulbifer yueqingensis]